MAERKGDNQKLKMLYLVKIFHEETDDGHALTMPQIIDELAKYGKPIYGSNAWILPAPDIEELIGVQGGFHHHVVPAGGPLRLHDAPDILQRGGHGHGAGAVLARLQHGHRLIRVQRDGRDEMDRVCMGIEIDEKFVDVIVKRYIQSHIGR